RDGLAWARRQIAEGRYATARSRLARLSAWWPRRGEVEYLLGVCEAALGRPEDALAAWGRVPVGSPPAGAAGLAGGRTLQGVGRLTEAEAADRAAARGTAATAIEARWSLAGLLIWQGRRDEVHRLFEEIARIGPTRDRAIALRERWRLDAVIVAAEEVQPVLDRATHAAPDDDRAWLVPGCLASQYGRHAEAGR